MLLWIISWLSWFFSKALTRTRVEGRHNIPRHGAFLLVSNHISHFDPPVLSGASPRLIDWLASDILLRGWFWTAFFRGLKVVPVRQYEADHRALRETLRRLHNGRCVGVFAEGGIRAGATSLLATDEGVYNGAFVLAALGRCPIIPCLVIGSDRLYAPAALRRRPPIWVRFGEPIHPGQGDRSEAPLLKQRTLEAIRGMAAELKASGKARAEDWPQTPQQRNPRLRSNP